MFAYDPHAAHDDVNHILSQQTPDNKEETHAIEAEVYEGGETEVYLTLYRELTDIKDLWPAETA